MGEHSPPLHLLYYYNKFFDVVNSYDKFVMCCTLCFAEAGGKNAEKGLTKVNPFEKSII